VSRLRLRDDNELRRLDSADVSSVTSHTENGHDDRRCADNSSAELFSVTTSLRQSSGDDMIIGMVGVAMNADVVSSTRGSRHNRALFAAPFLRMTSSLVEEDARELESSLFQLRIGRATRHGRSTGRTERPERQHAGGLGPMRDIVRAVCGSDKVRLAASLDSRIVGNATAVSGSSAAFVNAARYDAVLPAPAAG